MGLVIPLLMISALPPACSPHLLPVTRLTLPDEDVSSIFELSWPITKSFLSAKWLFSFFPLPEMRAIPFLADPPIPYSLRVSTDLSPKYFQDRGHHDFHGGIDLDLKHIFSIPPVLLSSCGFLSWSFKPTAPQNTKSLVYPNSNPMASF